MVSALLGVRDKERKPWRGLGVGEGDGNEATRPGRFSGVSDKGLRFKLDGRGFEGVALVMERAGVTGVFGEIGVFGGGGIAEMAGEGRTVEISCSASSSSSSSSSKRVPSWSFEEEDELNSLNESRLPLAERELAKLDKGLVAVIK